jgi:hypothetical protein
MGTILGYLLNDLLISSYSIYYNIYIKNTLKYFSIFIFQNIISKILLDNYVIMDATNILRLLTCLFIYVLLDIILDVAISDKNKNKDMYMDIIRASIGFIIIEVLLYKKLDSKHYTYISIIVFALFIYYSHFDEHLKKILK